jgi:inhibitor of growth protein 4
MPVTKKKGYFNLDILVDKHIRRLDGDLAKFEAEMREKGGKLSQTETEEDDENDDAKKKGKRKSAKLDVSKSGKKRGRKDAATPVVEEKKKKKGGATPKLSETPMASIAASLIPVPQEVLDMPVDPNEPTYCLCQQVSGLINFLLCR